MSSAVIADDTGTVFAGIRAGQLVRVIEDHVGDDGDYAQVEVDAPVALRGRVWRHALWVFARRELEVVKDWASWLAETPLQVRGGDARGAVVGRFESHLPDASVPCSTRIAAGTLARTAQGRCLEQAVIAIDGGDQRVGDDCSFSYEWDAEPITILGRMDRRLSATVSPDRGAYSGACPRGSGDVLRRSDHKLRCDVEGDAVDLCLGASCRAALRAWLFVRAVIGDNLAQDVTVTARRGAQTVAVCQAPSGACFLHRLEPGKPLTLEVTSAGAARSFLTVTPTPGVAEVTLRLR